MAKILTEVLGAADMLPPTPEDTGVLPCPEKLKRKVLLKGKRLPSAKKAEEPVEEEEEEEEEEEVPAESPEQPEEKPKEKKKKEKHGTAKELSDLIHLKTCSVKSFKENKGNKPV
jgi:hypothetical protein